MMCVIWCKSLILLMLHVALVVVIHFCSYSQDIWGWRKLYDPCTHLYKTVNFAGNIERARKTRNGRGSCAPWSQSSGWRVFKDGCRDVTAVSDQILLVKFMGTGYVLNVNLRLRWVQAKSDFGSQLQLAIEAKCQKFATSLTSNTITPLRPSVTLLKNEYRNLCWPLLILQDFFQFFHLSGEGGADWVEGDPLSLFTFFIKKKTPF